MKKDTTEKKLNKRLLELINSDSYLYSVRDAAQLCRLNRETFIQDYLAAGGKLTIIKGVKYIRHEHLREYQYQFLMEQSKAS